MEMFDKPIIAASSGKDVPLFLVVNALKEEFSPVKFLVETAEGVDKDFALDVQMAKVDRYLS